MEDLYERTHEIVHLGVREGTDVVYVGKISGHRQAPAPSRLGGRMPLHCTAIGKVLLAHGDRDLFNEIVDAGLSRRTPRTMIAPGLLRLQLDKIRDTGVAFEYEESAVGIACVAAAILGTDETPIAAVSVTGPITRFRPEAHATAVRAAADGIASILARRESMTGTNST